MKILYDKYSDQGLEILVFPCNNFGGQEPGTNEEILQYAAGFGANFPIFGKLECDNGNQTHPLFEYLKSSKSSVFGKGLKWNFAKFLCNEDGVVMRRYFPTTSPLGVEKDIKVLLEGLTSPRLTPPKAKSMKKK
jgi:glutathione peroxidase